METFILSLLVLLATILLTGILAVTAAVCPPGAAAGRLSNILGPLGAATACALGLAGVLSGQWSGVVALTLPWGLPLGSCSLGLDPLSRLFLLPVFGLGLVCALSGGMSLRHTPPQEHNLGAHWFFYALLLLGMILVMSARDTVLFILSWEIMSLAPFFLIDFNDGDSKVRDASWVYLVAAHLGAVALIAFFALFWHCTGTTSLEILQSGEALRTADPALRNSLFVLALLGFGAKAGLAPLHVWLPEAHPAAPSHVSALLSGAMINAGLYGVLRSLSLLNAPGDMTSVSEWWGWCLLLLGLGTGLMGILKALAQSNLKRMLAYSSVENMGLMFMGAGVGLIGQSIDKPWMVLLGFAGALMHMLNHAGFKGLLFLCAGEVLHATGTVRMEHLGGLQKQMPLVGAAFALGAAAIACLPPLSGFAGEFVLAVSMLQAPALPGLERQIGLLLTLTGLALISGLAAALYAKAYGVTFLGEPRSSCAIHPHVPDWRTLWPLALPALSCLAGGLLAPWFFSLASATAAQATPHPQELLAQSHEIQLWMLHNLGMIARVGAALIGLCLLLLAVRHCLLRRRNVRREPTWGCGFQAGTARIQYTDASFSEPLACVFAPIMGLKKNTQPVSGLFARRASLQLSAPDRLRSGLFSPLFDLVLRICNACKIIQHGKIHLYILYILVTLVGLLFWGLGA
ncbi:MAG: proton-conducting transporter membrane subunit [Desulfovibrionaceae bacterium]|nr:proton-conducting transporter membrane subunit [Desulfovibrionaceae bacterium]